MMTLSDSNSCLTCSLYKEEILQLKQENERIKKERDDVSAELVYLQEEIEKLQSKYVYSYNNMSKDANLFKKSTGLEVEQFDILFTYLNPGTNI